MYSICRLRRFYKCSLRRYVIDLYVNLNYVYVVQSLSSTLFDMLSTLLPSTLIVCSVRIVVYVIVLYVNLNYVYVVQSLSSTLFDMLSTLLPSTLIVCSVRIVVYVIVLYVNFNYVYVVQYLSSTLFDMLSTLLLSTLILCSLRWCILRCCTLRYCTLRCCALRWNFVCIRCFIFWLYTLQFSRVIYVENVVVYVVFDNNVYNMLSTSFLCYLRCCTLRHCTLRWYLVLYVVVFYVVFFCRLRHLSSASTLYIVRIRQCSLR